jgi:hypothetical protein
MPVIGVAFSPSAFGEGAPNYEFLDPSVWCKAIIPFGGSSNKANVLRCTRFFGFCNAHKSAVKGASLNTTYIRKHQDFLLEHHEEELIYECFACDWLEIDESRKWWEVPELKKFVGAC